MKGRFSFCLRCFFLLISFAIHSGSVPSIFAVMKSVSGFWMIKNIKNIIVEIEEVLLDTMMSVIRMIPIRCDPDR